MRAPSRSRPGARRRLAVALAVLVAVGVALVLLVTRSSAPTIGYDASYPQCSSGYPSKPLFGIVGVNGGLANNANPCLGGELRWARATSGQTRPVQPRLSLYIDTAAAARSAPWWLDVELNASWAGTYRLNVAALQGFVAGLRRAGATGAIGIYSTGAQWKDITGLTAQTTSTAFHRRLPDWVAGTVATRAQAQQSCASGGFTGDAPTLAQYRIGSLDADLRC